MSTLFTELERATGALSCSTVAAAATYSSQVLQQQQQQQQQHTTLRQSSNGSTSPTSQISSSLSQSPLSSVSSPTQQHQQQQSSISPTTILSSSTSTPPLSSLAGSNTTNCNSSNLSPIGGSPSSTVNGLVEDQRALQLAFELSMVGLSDTLSATTNHHHHHHQQHNQHQSLQQSVLHQQLQDNTNSGSHSHHHHQHHHQSHSPQSYADLTSVVLSNQQMLQQQQQQHLLQQQQQQQQQSAAATTNGLSGVLNNSSSIANDHGNCNGLSSVQQHHHHHQHHQQQQSTNGCPQSLSISAAFSSILPPGIDERSKKSQNMTECVPVPSSEHVAEIVGRQGCKIKALRAKTNTYIKTPVRGEEPVFVVTGRKEDVGKAKREILSAAEHFSLIRASRKPTLSGLGGKGSPPGPPTNIPGQVTIQVRVPYRVVGLVVGPKGATIKHIQQQTHTYIVTPSRDKEPIFEVTGMPDNVQSARRQIEAHIALRTGNIAIAAAAATGQPANTTTGSITGLGSLLGDEANSEFLTSLYKNGFGSLLGYLEPTLNDQSLQQQTPATLHQQRSAAGLEHLPATMSAHHHHHQQQHHHPAQYAPVLSSSTGGSRSCSSSSSSTSSKSATRSQPELINIWKSLGDSIDVDEGLGESPNIWTMPVTSALGSRCSPSSTSVSPTDSLLGGAGGSSTSSSGGSGGGGGSGNGNVNSGGGVNGGNSTVSMLSTNAAAALCRRECLVCGDKEVTAALVPCGHNMFCMDCATRVCTPLSTNGGNTTANGGTGNDGICPVCSQTVLQAIRIIP